MSGGIVLAMVCLVVVARSAVFVFRRESYFDADQAIVGLMAKHLSELRAFPLFFCGQTYTLGVEAWLAAPLFAIAGVSATALTIPLLMMNAAIAALLLRAFERDLGLRPALAAVAALPFVLPAPGLASAFLDSNGGTLPPDPAKRQVIRALEAHGVRYGTADYWLAITSTS